VERYKSTGCKRRVRAVAGDSLAHAFRISAHLDVLVPAKREQVEEPVSFGCEGGFRHFAKRSNHFEIFPTGEVRIEIRFFGHVTQVPCDKRRDPAGCCGRRSGLLPELVGVTRSTFLRWCFCRSHLDRGSQGRCLERFGK